MEITQVSLWEVDVVEATYEDGIPLETSTTKFNDRKQAVEYAQKKSAEGKTVVFKAVCIVEGWNHPDFTDASLFSGYTKTENPAISFYGKYCNYAFRFSDNDDFDVFFIQNEEDNRKDVIDLLHDHWNSVDTCILWAGYQTFVIRGRDFRWKRVNIQDECCNLVLSFISPDKLVEAMWKTLTDVNIDDAECIEQPWFIFPAGTSREDIWHWFDEHHSKGVGWLLNNWEESGEELNRCPICESIIEPKDRDDKGDTLCLHWKCGFCGNSGRAVIDANNGNAFVKHILD